jgi:hypothetical protein
MTTLAGSPLDENVKPSWFSNSHGTIFEGSGRGVCVSYTLCATLGPGSLTESSRGDRNVKAMATAPRPMPNEPI